MKKKLSFLILAIATFVLAGCGNKEIAKQEEASSTSVEAVLEQTEKRAEKEAEETRIIQDMNGEDVEVPREIKRVVVFSMYPLPSIITTYLGSGAKVVGMDPFSYAAAENGLLGKMYPDILNADTSFMQGDIPNIEAVIALKPDVVLYNARSDEQKQMLENAGLTGIAVHAQQNDYNCIETYNDWFRLMEAMFPGEGPSEDEITEYSKTVYDKIQERTNEIPQEKRMRALHIFRYDDKTMVVSGKNFFGNFWINMAGGINVAEDLDKDGASPVNMEQIYDWNPDIIYITNFTPTMPEDLYENAIGEDDWSNVNAVKNHNVHKMPLGSYRTFTPGVDTPVTMLWVAQTMYPEQFSDVDIKQEFKDYYKKFFNAMLSDEEVDNIVNPPREAAGTW